MKMNLTVRVDKSKFNRLRESLDAAPRTILDQVGRETVAWLKDTVAGGIGGWQNRTGELRDSYGYRIEGGRLVVFNDAGHAIHVEQMEGLFVLTGIDEPGGPMEQALKRAVQQHLPGFKVRG